MSRSSPAPFCSLRRTAGAKIKLGAEGPKPQIQLLLGSHRLLWPTDSRSRALERDAILATKSAWRRAYQGRPPTPRELAVPELLELLPELVAATERLDESHLLLGAASTHRTTRTSAASP